LSSSNVTSGSGSSSPWRQRALLPTLVGLGLVIGLISSLGAPLVPLIATETGVGLATAQWTLTANLVAGAVLTPVLGRLATGDGLRRTTLGALAVCALGTALGVPELGFGGLLVGRTLQGVSLALLPLAIAVTRSAVPPESFARTASLVSVSGVAGIGLGYPVTSLATHLFGIRPAFALGTIISLLVLAAAWLVIPVSRGEPVGPVDWLGAAVLAVGVGAFLLSLSLVGTGRWLSSSALGVTSVTMVGWWVFAQLRRAAPLVDLRLSRHPAVMRANWAALIAGITVYTMFSLATQYIQVPVGGLNRSVTAAGMAVLPFSLCGLAGGRVGLWLKGRWGVRTALVWGNLVCALSLALLATPSPAYLVVLVVMALGGLGTGVIFAIVPLEISDAVSDRESPSALSFSQLVRALGFAIGSALTSALLEPYVPRGAIFPTSAG
jgi:MFS family permease